MATWSNLPITLFAICVASQAFSGCRRQGRPTGTYKVPAPPDFEVSSETLKLPPGKTKGGVHRLEPLKVAQGLDPEMPSVAVSDEGRMFVAWVDRLDGGREAIFVRSGVQALDAPQQVTHGARAWRPRLASGPSGVWLAWCGRQTQPRRGDHRRHVYLRRLHPTLEPATKVSGEGVRNCDPDLAVDADGVRHLVWESGDHTKSQIRYRAIGADKQPTETISDGWLDRRPTIIAMPSGVAVAWDALRRARTGAPDPDYDVHVRRQENSVWAQAVVIGGDGIQAAPALAADNEGLIVVFHTSDGHPLTKWWDLRRLTAQGMQALPFEDPARAALASGHQQGTEMPAIVTSTSGLFLASRAAQGAYLHVVTDDGVRPTVDLTRRGWGMRGLYTDMATGPGGLVLVSRRARHGVIVERLRIRGGKAPRFVGASSPRKPLAKPLPPKVQGVAFGDVHMHSAYSDGTGPPDEIYARARNRGLDFACLTDHDTVAGTQMAISKHEEIVWLTDLFDALEDFTAIHGYEWTTRPFPKGSGHRNVYFEGAPPSPLYGSKSGFPDTRGLHGALATERAFTAPHHTSWTGTDWANADPKIQRHFELVSVHGLSESATAQPLPARGAMPGMFAADGLSRGVRFGFLGGSDGHGLIWHHGIGRRADPWAHGLTGVLTETHSRRSIWRAMYARHTFATSGARMVVYSRVQDAISGEAVVIDGPLVMQWTVHGTQPLTAVEVLENGRVIHREVPGGTRHEGTFTLSSPPTNGAAYYIRAVQGAGVGALDAVWSSPIFAQPRNR